MPYHGVTICRNRHVVNLYKDNASKFCPICGAETYSKCPHCNTSIKGLWYSPDVLDFRPPSYDVPSFCEVCAAPYPWTEKILENAVELIELDDELDLSTKELIKTAIPDLVSDTLSTPVAINKYRKGIAKAGEILANSLRSLLIDVVSETTKKLLFS